MNHNFLVRVYRKEGGAAIGVRIGTAYPIAPERILVARHVLANEGQDIELENITLTWFRFCREGGKRLRTKPVKLAWDGAQEGNWDAAILECPFPDGVSIPPNILSYRRPGRDERWHSEGFANAGVSEEGREPQPLQGTTYFCSHDARTFQLVEDGPAGLAEGWQGISGAPVFVNECILGLIIEVPEAYGARRLKAIPTFRLLELPGFREAARLPPADACPAIDLARFKTEIEKQLLAVPKVVERLQRTLSSRLPDWGLEDLLPLQEYRLGKEEARAGILVRAFVDDIPFVYALEVLTEAIESCTTEPEQKERQALFVILYCFLPARFGLQKAQEVKRLYERGDVHLIQADVASALAAELVMAAVQNRPVSVDRDSKSNLAGNTAIQSHLPLGLGATPKEELLRAVSEYLFAKYGTGLSARSMEEFLSRLNNIMRRRKGRDAPYLLFGGDTAKSPPSDEELGELARAAHEKLPWLAILKLSDADEVKLEELDQLFSLREILMRY